MCGIYGEFNLQGACLTGHYAQKATDVISHRGPDDGVVWHGGRIILGMRRLSIIDLPGGMQPIWNEDHTCCVVYNGELYNFCELRKELEAFGHLFRTDSDTEVIVHAYEQWGVDCLRRFNGMFGFALWDSHTQQLMLARDRIGEKPLYYYCDRDRLVFASEIKAILADPAVSRNVNLKGLSNFLAFGHAMAPETIYRQIFKLLPGHFLLAKDGGFSIHEYWDVGDEPQHPSDAFHDEERVAQWILDILDDSVRRRMVADVPVGAFLSGGVDSSAIVALMKRHATGPVKTFSLGFKIGGAYNELSDARQVAQALGTDHYELEVGHEDLVHTLQTLVYHYDEPFGDAAGFPVYLLSRFAREHVKVVLAGDGADELFGGYRRYAYDRLAPYYSKLPQVVTSQWIPRMLQHLPRFRRIKRTLKTLPLKDPARRYASWLMLFTPDMQRELLQPTVMSDLMEYDPQMPYSKYYRELSTATASDHSNRLMYIDLKTLLPDAYMEKVDKAAMACGLETRLPFLDPRLVELACQIPSRYKVRGLSTKLILKQAVRGVVPESVLRKPKHGFAVPTDQWFQGHLRDFLFEILLDERTRARGYFNMSFIEQLWREHHEGQHVWNVHLWLLMNFELWHRTYLDNGTTPIFPLPTQAYSR
ncbi:MAG: asparagine synthase (glutamine-hydrolyzing) [Nitrospira sp.]|nr:asparagine synthase (glutamine-hydrolyzing) [Nitrospira sp.]